MDCASFGRAVPGRSLNFHYPPTTVSMLVCPTFEYLSITFTKASVGWLVTALGPPSIANFFHNEHRPKNKNLELSNL